jgi:hypothetical protein
MWIGVTPVSTVMHINSAVNFERSFICPQNASRKVGNSLTTNQNYSENSTLQSKYLLLAFVKDEGGMLSILMLSQFNRHWYEE